MTNSAKVILNKKEVRSNTGSPPGPIGLTSSEDAALPLLSLEAKAEEQQATCRGLRREIVRSRPLIDLDMISYARLSLLNAKMADNDGTTYLRLAANMDISFENNAQFQKFKWRVTNKRSEFYANIPAGWETDLAYGTAWEYFNELTCHKWIGKATYRLNFRDRDSRMKLVPFTAMVLWTPGDRMHYRFWIENAEVDGAFNLDSDSRFYMAASQPIKNFRPQGMQVIQL